MPSEADVALELLRTQLLSCRAQAAVRTRALQRTEALLQRYLELLFPHLIAQALAAELSISEVAETLYGRHLNAGDSVGDPVCGREPEANVTVAASVDPGVPLSGDAVKLLYVAGLRVLSTEIKALWAEHTGKAVGTARNTVLPELLDAGLLRVERIPAPGYLTGYATDTCYLLTEAGEQEYRRRFSADPITYQAAYAPYKSPEAWWQVRATRALIEAGTAHSGNSRFSYSVYDPTGDPEPAERAGFQRRYGHSEPDLIVAVSSKSGGNSSRIAVECERGSYTATRLKQKLIKNLQDYGEAGFSGCYYVANSGSTARSLGAAFTKVRADLKAHPDASPVRGFLALFTLEALKETWLPTPHFVDQHFFDRQARQVNTAWPATAAKPERYLKCGPPSSDRVSQSSGVDHDN